MSGKKKALFFTGMLLIPVLILVILEATLVIVNYGGDFRLVLENESDSRFLRLNHQIGRRYFPTLQTATIVSYDTFRKEKPENGLRFFVFGGSSAAGYPYMNNGSFSSILRWRLTRQYPHRVIEVVNSAMPAVNTFTVLDFVKSLIKYQPDGFIFYTGHNEYYGALGAGSTESLGKSRGMIKLYLRLQKVRTARLLRDVIWFFRSKLSHQAQTASDATLMERMVGNQNILYGDETYNRGLDFFQKNVSEIIRICQKHDVPLIFGDLVSNVADHRPFVSHFGDEGQKAEWKEIVQTGADRINQKKFSDALPLFQNALEKSYEDPYQAPAIVHYLIGLCLEQDQRFDKANTAYLLAKDCDGLRFRASEGLNRALLQVCQKRGVPCIKLTDIFQDASPHGLIGDNLMTDHLHPNLDGYQIMAHAFLQQMRKENWVPAIEEKNEDQRVILHSNEIGVTDLDLEAANLKIRILKGGWPFKSRSSINRAYDDKPDTQVEKIAWKWQKHKINWEAAHVAMADHYKQAGQLEKAYQEYRTLMIGTPFNVSPFLHGAELAIFLKDFARADSVLTQSLKVEETAYAHKWIGTLRLNDGDSADALSHLKRAHALDSQDDQTLYNLSGAYFQQGEIKNAMAKARELKKRNPHYPGLQPFFQGLEQMNADQ